MLWAVAHAEARDKPTTWDIAEMVARYGEPTAAPSDAALTGS
jgi:hypothetical protein